MHTSHTLFIRRIGWTPTIPDIMTARRERGLPIIESDSLLHELDERLHMWREEDADLRARIAELHARRAVLTERIQHASRLRGALLGEDTSQDAADPGDARPVTDEEVRAASRDAVLPAELEPFRGLSQMDVMRRLARTQGGVLRVSQARDVIRKLGISQGAPKNLHSQLYRMLHSSRDFRKSDPGTFILVVARDQVGQRVHAARDAETLADSPS